MRDPSRLYKFYNQLMQLHMEFLPDMRFGQLMICFMEWYKKESENDVFYLEEDEFYNEFMIYATQQAF